MGRADARVTLSVKGRDSTEAESRFMAVLSRHCDRDRSCSLDLSGTAIDEQLAAVDEAALVRCKEEGSVRALLRFAETS